MAVGEAQAAARRYADAVMELAREARQLDEWSESLTVLAAVARDPGTVAFLENGRTPLPERLAVIERAMAGLQPQALNLTRLLVSRGRFALAPAIADRFQVMLDAERGVVRASVVTAVPMEEADRQAVAERLRVLSGANDVRLETSVDPTIIGGLVARVGDRLIDGSTRSRLQQLKRRLAGTER